jgi:hypothetical protein
MDYPVNQFRTRWKRIGGDWKDRDGVLHGTNFFATAQSPGVGGDMTFSGAGLAALIEAQVAHNTGMLVKRASGGTVNFASKENTASQIPRLVVTTLSGAFECPVVFDIGLNQGAAGDGTVNLPTLNNPFIIKFDLSGVSGEVTDASLTFRVTSISGTPPGSWNINQLWPPRVYSNPTAEGLTPRYGIARQVASEASLKGHPDVLFFQEFPDFASTWRDSDMWANTTNDSSKYAVVANGSDEFIDQPEYGTKKLRVTAQGVTVLNRSWNFCPPGWGVPLAGSDGSNIRPYSWDWGEGPNELFFRYRIRIDPKLCDVAVQHCKIAGLDATWDQLTKVDESTGPPYPFGTRPFDQSKVWSARLEISADTGGHERENYGLHKIWVYLYSAGGAHPGVGSGTNEHTQGYLVGGRDTWIEQRVKLNNFDEATQTWLSDAEMDIWIDGCLIGRWGPQTNNGFKLRASKYAQWQRAWMVFQHGGTTSSTGSFTIDYGNLCVARNYIGPGI